MKNLLKNLIIPSLLFSVSVNAEQCDIDNYKGEKFKFSSMSPAKIYSTSGKYQSWVYNEKTNENIKYNEFFNRTGVISDNFLEKRIKLTHDKSGYKIIRYYPALIDNCKKVFLKIDTTDKEFDYAFSKRNFMAKGKLNFFQHESRFNSIYEKTYFNYKENTGKEIYLMASGKGQKLSSNNLSKNKLYSHEPHSKLKLLSVIDKPFYFNGLEKSPYSLIVQDLSGDKFLAEANNQIIKTGNIFSASIREEFKKDILKGKLRYGMNKFEVQMAWGKPDLERRQVIYNEKGIGEYVKDDYIEYDEIEFKKRMKGQPLAGIEFDWYYFNKLPKDNYLVFDKHGVLREHNQVFRINMHILPYELEKSIEK